jgi:hypothetical protein
MAKHDYTEGPLSKGNMKCTDLPCLVLFNLFWIANAFVFYEAYKHGDVDRLVQATDYNADVCGKKGGPMADKPFGYYPRLAEDMLVALGEANNCAQDAISGELGECDVSLYTICVETCPNQGDIVCNYKESSDIIPVGKATKLQKIAASLRQACWATPIAQKTVFNRCAPVTDQRSDLTTHHCCYDKAARSKWQKSDDDRCPGGCCSVSEAGAKSCTGMIRVHTEIDYNTTAGMDGLMANLVSTEAIFERCSQGSPSVPCESPSVDVSQCESISRKVIRTLSFIYISGVLPEKAMLDAAGVIKLN